MIGRLLEWFGCLIGGHTWFFEGEEDGIAGRYCLHCETFREDDDLPSYLRRRRTGGGR